MKLVPVKQEHLLEMMEWFPDRASCTLWGGPEFRFPFTPEQFLADSKWQELPSFALIDDSDALCGFGQYYLRVGRCHLGRLAIKPANRGKGLGTRLISMLTQEGKRELAVAQCSLFVYPTNTSARALYEREGFTCVPYPDESFQSLDYHYMIRTG